MHNKIKKIRTKLCLSEKSISSLLLISSYKYNRIENGFLPLTTEYLLLFSIMFDLPIDFLIFENVNFETIIESSLLSSFIGLSEEQKIEKLKLNLCTSCAIKFGKMNYSIKRTILENKLKSFSNNLCFLIRLYDFDDNIITNVFNMDIEHLINLEKGKFFPKIKELIEISFFFNISIDEMFH